MHSTLFLTQYQTPKFLLIQLPQVIDEVSKNFFSVCSISLTIYLLGCPCSLNHPHIVASPKPTVSPTSPTFKSQQSQLQAKAQSPAASQPTVDSPTKLTAQSSRITKSPNIAPKVTTPSQPAKAASPFGDVDAHASKFETLKKQLDDTLNQYWQLRKRLNDSLVIRQWM